MKTEIGRLALRVEGDDWRAYYAMTDTMDGAIVLGSIRMGIVTKRPERKQQFMDLMRDAVADLIEERSGERPQWKTPHAAPERERAGRA